MVKLMSKGSVVCLYTCMDLCELSSSVDCWSCFISTSGSVSKMLVDPLVVSSPFGFDDLYDAVIVVAFLVWFGLSVGVCCVCGFCLCFPFLCAYLLPMLDFVSVLKGWRWPLMLRNVHVILCGGYGQPARNRHALM